MPAFKRSFFYVLKVYLPFLDKNKQKKEIIKRMRKDKNPFFDPVKRNFSAAFCSEFMKFIESLKRLRSIYENNYAGDMEARVRFEGALIRKILEIKEIPPEELDFHNVLNRAVEERNGSVKYADEIFKSRMEVFKDPLMEDVHDFILKNICLAELTRFEPQGILNQMKKNNAGYIPLPAEFVTKFIKDMLYLTTSINVRTDLKTDLVMLFALEKTEHMEIYSKEDVIQDLNTVRKGLISLLDFSFMDDVLMVCDDPLERSESFQPESEFPGNFKKTVLADYKKKRQAYIQKENERILEERKEQLFGPEDLSPVHVYNVYSFQLLQSGGISGFFYTDAIQVIKSFIQLVYEKEIQPFIQSIILEVDFIRPEEKEAFRNMYNGWTDLCGKIKKFEEDLSVPSSSPILPFLDMLKKEAIMTSAQKGKTRTIVREIDGDAQRIGEAFFDSAAALLKTFTQYNMDLLTENPMIMHRMVMKEGDLQEMIQKTEESSVSFNNFIRLLRMFSVQLTKAKEALTKEATNSQGE